MVKGQRKIQFVRVKHFDLLGVILSNRITFRVSDKNSRDRVFARIPLRVRIGVHLTFELNIQRGFFFGLPNSRILQGFAAIDKPPGQRPSEGRIFPLDEDDSLLTIFCFNLDDDIDGGHRVFVFFQG